MKCLIVVPAYNEEKNIYNVINSNLEILKKIDLIWRNWINGFIENMRMETFIKSMILL